MSETGVCRQHWKLHGTLLVVGDSVPLSLIEKKAIWDNFILNFLIELVAFCQKI